MATSEGTTFVAQKDLATQQRASLSQFPIPCEEFCQMQPQRTKVALFMSTNYKTYASED